MEIKDQTKVNTYLTFKIGNEEFGAHVKSVQNILELQKITMVPKSPDYMKGVINLRGKVLPIIDTRIKIGMAPIVFTDDTCIVVMNLLMEEDIVRIGALVDSVEAVREIDQGQIQPPPSIGNNYQSDFITGVVKIEDHLIMILDLVELFSDKELNELKSQN